MDLLRGLFGRERGQRGQTELDKSNQVSEAPPFRYEEIPNTLDLGWYWSEEREEFQMAKISQEDRATHTYVIGATGTGKTKFLEFLIQQDIERGNGFGVIDPHGDLVEDIKGFLACYYGRHQGLRDRVVVIDPTDPDFTATFNPLEQLPGITAGQQARELVSAFKRIWSSSWGPRMENLLRNSLIALGEAGLTLVELPSFLTSEAFRRGVLEEVSHAIAKEYFAGRFDVLTERRRITWIEPVMNKLEAFLSDGRIRQILSHPESSFDLREIMDGGKILLINLDKGQLRDSGDLLGSLLMAKMVMATFSRSDLPQSRRVPFYLYIDEFQNYATESFSVVLSEARKYGLSLVMAHQTLGQVPRSLRDLILGNCGIQVYFRLGRKDAELLAKEGFRYYGKRVKDVWVSKKSSGHRYWSYAEEWEGYIEELQNLPLRFCYVKHSIEGGMILIQTAEITPPWETLGVREDEYPDFLRGLPLGEKYLLPRGELEERVQARREEVVEGKVEPESFRIPQRQK